jgi:hypothetical protein
VGVGVSTPGSLSGDYDIICGGRTDTDDFVTPVQNAHTAAMAIRAGTVSIPFAEIGGITFTPGTYHASSLNIAAGGIVTLNGEGDPNSVFLFQVESTMLTGANCKILLEGQAKAENVLWAIGTTFTSGAGNNLEGTIMAGTVTFGGTNTVHGSVIAQTVVTSLSGDAVYGCVIGLTLVTFKALSSVTVNY